MDFRAPLLALLFLVSLAGAQPSERPALVRVGVAAMQEVSQRRTVIGRIEPARRSRVAAEEAGRIVQAPPEPGLPVEAGQVLAKIDDTILQAHLASGEAAVTEAEARIQEHQAQLDLSERNYQRVQELRSRQAAQEKEVADARSTMEADRARFELAQAQLRGAQAQLGLMQARVAKTRVVAPFDGFVVTKGTELGQWVEPGGIVSELVEIRRVKARLNVAQELVPHVDAEGVIALHVDALDETREAPLFSIVPDADPQSRTFVVLVKLDNEGGALKPGMSVSADLPTGRKETVLMVPRDAVQATPTGSIVYAHRGGVAALVPVRVRFGHGDRFAVEGELREGEEVVIEGNERLRPGQPLKVVGGP